MTSRHCALPLAAATVTFLVAAPGQATAQTCSFVPPNTQLVVAKPERIARPECAQVDTCASVQPRIGMDAGLPSLVYDCPVLVDDPTYKRDRSQLVELAMDGLLVIADQIEQCQPGGLGEVMRTWARNWPDLMAPPKYGAEGTPPLAQFVNIEAEGDQLVAKAYDNRTYAPTKVLGSPTSRRSYFKMCRPLHSPPDGLTVRPNTAVIVLRCHGRTTPDTVLPKTICANSRGGLEPLEVTLRVGRRSSPVPKDVKRRAGLILGPVAQLRDLEVGWRHRTCSQRIEEGHERHLVLAYTGDLQEPAGPCTVKPATFGLSGEDMRLLSDPQLSIFATPRETTDRSAYATKVLSFLPHQRLRGIKRHLDAGESSAPLPLIKLRSAYQTD
ncbi:MAG: hypothetical protein QF464_13215, partial [Myxococcota bacterium]|nr:hypothetical protein [Myxococcota bacterium]